MTAKILDGKAVSTQLLTEVRTNIDLYIQQGCRKPVLAVILVGDDPASHIYVRNKKKACERAGVQSISHDLPSNIEANELFDLIDQLNHDSQIDGILVQLPLPEHIEDSEVINAIDPSKDVDGFHPQNMGRLALRQPGLRSCTPMGVMQLLSHYGIDSKGMDSVVVGASNHVGRPMVMELLLAGSTATCCHKFTRNLAFQVSRADLLVVAVGKPGLIPGQWVKPGAIVVDIGINRLSDGSLSGDVGFSAAAERAAWITPVPGGVGPMTVACLIQNTLSASIAQQKSGK